MCLEKLFVFTNTHRVFSFWHFIKKNKTKRVQAPHHNSSLLNKREQVVLRMSKRKRDNSSNNDEQSLAKKKTTPLKQKRRSSNYHVSDDEQEVNLVPDCYQDPEAYKVIFKDAYVQRGDKLVFVGENWKVLKAAMPTVLKAWNKSRIEYCESKMTSEIKKVVDQCKKDDVRRVALQDYYKKISDDKSVLGKFFRFVSWCEKAPITDDSLNWLLDLVRLKAFAEWLAVFHLSSSTCRNNVQRLCSFVDWWGTYQGGSTSVSKLTPNSNKKISENEKFNQARRFLTKQSEIFKNKMNSGNVTFCLELLLF